MPRYVAMATAVAVGDAINDDPAGAGHASAKDIATRPVVPGESATEVFGEDAGQTTDWTSIKRDAILSYHTEP